MPKDVAASSNSANGAIADSTAETNGHGAKGSPEKPQARSWNAILVVAVIGIVLVAVTFLNSNTFQPGAPQQFKALRRETPEPQGLQPELEAQTKAAAAKQDDALADKLEAETQAPQSQEASHNEEPIETKVAATASWTAPSFASGGYADLACENGTKANVIFKEGKHTQMCVHPGGEIISVQISATGAWEADLCKRIQHYERLAAARTGGDALKWWFVDVGANIGFLSLCGFQVLPTVSIEAAPWNYAMVSQTRAHWQSRWEDRPWYLIHQAVSMTAGNTIKLLGSFKNFGGSTLVNPENHPHHASGWGEGAEIRYGSVVTETLDGMINTHVPPESCVAVMKVDIEGYEYFAMQSFSEFLKTRPPCNILMEYHTILLKAASSKNRDDPSALNLVALLVAAGYTPDQAIPQNPTEDREMNIHWRLLAPPVESSCDCTGLTDPYR